MFVVIHKHDVQIAAVAQFFAAQFAISQDGKLRFVAMPLLEVLPHPLAGDLQHAVRECTQIIGHLLHADAFFHIARQGAKHFGVVGTAQQIEQGFFVCLVGRLQGLQAQRQLALKHGRVKAFAQQGRTGQLVNHTRVLQQIFGRPARQTQQAQQLFMHARALDQQGQIALPAQQGFHPVTPAQRGLFVDAALFEPCIGALKELDQPLHGVVAQAADTRFFSPAVHMRRQPCIQCRQQGGPSDGVVGAWGLVRRRVVDPR